MIPREKLVKVDDQRWVVPRDAHPNMRTEAMVYASEALLEHIVKDQSLEQAANVA